MTSYKLPANLGDEIDQLEVMIAKFKAGQLSATELKVHRVPFGVYEQREPDTYMVRIRCAAGTILLVQLKKVAAIAAQYGVGDLHITSRQELQIHYVKLDDLVVVMRRLKEIGLATRGGGGNTVRNIVVPEDAGIDPEEVFDVTPFAFALTDRLIAEQDSWNLPRKFKITFSGSAQDKGYATISDVGFIARVRDGKKGFTVYTAGGLGAKPAVGKQLLDFVDEDQVYAVAKALKNVFWKYGNRRNKHAARLRFLWQTLGEEEFRKRFNEELLEVRKSGALPLEIDVTSRPSVRVLSEDRGQVSSHDPHGFELWQNRFVKPQPQTGLYSVLVPVEFGFISCETTVRLAEFLEPFGDDVVRMTKDQNFFLRNIPASALGGLYDLLQKGFSVAMKPVLYGRVLSCAGASTCQLGICLSRQAAKALMKSFDDSGFDLDKVGDIKLNISGCPNSCGHHQAADLGFSGKALRKEGHMYPAYTVFAGAVINDAGTSLAQSLGDIPAKQLPAMVKELLAVYLLKQTRYPHFRSYIQGDGKEDLRQIIARYQDVPDFDVDKNYYFDWGAQAPFSLVGRGTGECSAGLFDLIGVDQDHIKQIRQKLSVSGVEVAQRQALLRMLVFHASRMLLITRGVEPKDDHEAYEAFRRYFIETELVDAVYQPLLKAAETNDVHVLTEKENDAFGLAQAVEVLFENMDNGFNFKKIVPAVQPEVLLAVKQSEPSVVKDLRGVLCPLNFVKTKVELSKLKSGGVLEIWLDEGAPIENVPGSVKGEGHKILVQEKTGDHWKVVIEKK